MSINHNNIDQWLFNYYEGTLSPSEISKLEGFLKVNPEYLEDAQAWKNSFIEEPVPAFDTASLVKDTSNKKENRKLALVALALLLIGTMSTYLILNQDNGDSSKSSGELSVIASENSTIAPSASNSGKSSGVPVVVVVNNFVDLSATKDENNTTSENNNQNTTTAFVLSSYNPNRTVNPIETLPNYTNSTLPNTNSTMVSSVEFNTTNNTTANSTLTSVNTSTTNNSAVSTTEMNASTNPFSIETNGSATTPIETIAVNDELSATTTENPTKGHELNLTTINEQDLKEVALLESAEENINLTNGLTETKPVTEITSELNPDHLAKQSGLATTSTKDELIDRNDKIKIPTSRGLKLTNLKNVIVLQPTLFDFQNNASFAIQNYVLDGYTAGSFRQTGNKEYSSTTIAGVSHTVRKIRTTFNGFTEYGRNSFSNHAGITLQGATNFKLDRQQNLIPSVSLSYTRYGFNNHNTSTSWFNQELTTLNENFAMKTSNQVNFSTGVLYHHKKFFTSIALNGLLQPNFTYVKGDNDYHISNSARINFVGGTEFVSNKRPELSFSPQLAIEVKNMEANVTLGGYMRFRSFFAGSAIGNNGLTALAGINHRAFSLQYRFVYQNLETPENMLHGHFLSARFNMKGLMKKQKAILDSER